MKKLGLLVMPLMAVSFLASCNGGDKPKPNQYILKLILDDCTVDGESTYSRTYIEGDTIDEIVVTPNADCVFTEESVDEQYRDNWEESETSPGSYVLSDIVMNTNREIRIDCFGEYGISVGTADHLLFTAADGGDIATAIAMEDHNFTFKMMVNNNFNGTIYKIPTQLSIYIGDSEIPLIPEKYKIQPSPEPSKESLEATVIIFGPSVSGSIKISGNAIPVNYYKISIDCYGVDSDFNPESPYVLITDEKVITFIQLESYDLPKTENMYLCFDGSSTWINPADVGASEYCEYNETTHKLTIKANAANSNVQIKVRSPEYQILKELDWKKINDYSTAGYAPYLFYPGEEKTIQVNGLDHIVRIIGFNHDDLASKTGKAGVTFEFANVITDSSGAVTTHWNDKMPYNYNFTNSTLNDLLNKNDDCIFSKLPTELKGVIKEVKKPIALGESYKVNDFTTKLFPLSYREITASETLSDVKEEGSTYAFYQGSGDTGQNRIKTAVNGTEEAYWLRSPITSEHVYAVDIIESGGFYKYDYVYRAIRAVAPAFCI